MMEAEEKEVSSFMPPFFIRGDGRIGEERHSELSG
jgi:hypothetical protein